VTWIRSRRGSNTDINESPSRPPSGSLGGAERASGAFAARVDIKNIRCRTCTPSAQGGQILMPVMSRVVLAP
jgi:hypothetical protein